MNEIEAGDLVMVVKPATCCGGKKTLGKIFTAGDNYRGLCQCGTCGIKFMEDLVWVQGEHRVYEKSRLRRIPPLWELDETEHKEELPA